MGGLKDRDPAQAMDAIDNFMLDEIFGGPLADTSNAFERYGSIARHIERMAATGSTGSMVEWSNFLAALNTVLMQQEAERDALAEKVKGLEEMVHVHPVC